MRVVGL